MTAAHFRTASLCAIVDANGLQIDGRVAEVMNVEPLVDKFAAFGWHATSCDGHDFEQLLAAFEQARACSDLPSVIVARTIKGKGVSDFEDKVEWHGKAPGDTELTIALRELGEPLREVT